jgi:hypothetical protein
VPIGTRSELSSLQINTELEVQMEKLLYQELKFVFFDWCSLLSLNECISNPDLIKAIERLERLLITAAE